MATLLRAALALYAAQYRSIFLYIKLNKEHFLNIQRIQQLVATHPGDRPTPVVRSPRLPDRGWGQARAVVLGPIIGTDFDKVIVERQVSKVWQQMLASLR